MDIIVKAPLMADRIKEQLDGKTYGGVSYAYVDKKGMEMIFSTESADGADAVETAKKAIKSTDFGKGIYFSVVKK